MFRDSNDIRDARSRLGVADAALDPKHTTRHLSALGPLRHDRRYGADLNRVPEGRAGPVGLRHASKRR